jgi:hypothetical protein
MAEKGKRAAKLNSSLMQRIAYLENLVQAENLNSEAGVYPVLRLTGHFQDSVIYYFALTKSQWYSSNVVGNA